MPRKPRIELSGAPYHVMSWGAIEAKPSTATMRTANAGWRPWGGVREAEDRLLATWARSGWEAEEILEGPKGSEPKRVLAWWLCTRSVATRHWVAEQLGMGHETRVS